MTPKDLPFLPEFFDRYINLVHPEIGIIEALGQTKLDFANHKIWLLKNPDYRYAPDKWTPRDLLQHLIDNERIQSYRALAFARKDKVALPGYDENLYANNTNANSRSINDLLSEFEIVRDATLKLFSNFTPEQLLHEGICSKIRITVLALGFQIVGHAIHHNRILEERYLQPYS